MAPVRWGLLSTARINGAILHAAASTPAAEVAAVASRDAARAREYARLTGIPRAHGSYEGLLADPEVDAVYVSPPNSLHAEWSARALRAGKHVLCEKPFGRRPAPVAAAFDLAEAAGLVVMEGFMYRHRPQVRELERLLDEGAIGRVERVEARFCAPLERDDDPRWAPELDGGALMDLGCYCVNAIRLVLGEPAAVSGRAVLSATGVDASFEGDLRYAGASATFEAAFAGPGASGLEVVGTEGSITIADPWHGWSPGLELRRGGSAERLGDAVVDAHVLQLENMAAAIGGETPPRVGRADSVGQARVLEALFASAEAGGAAVELAAT